MDRKKTLTVKLDEAFYEELEKNARKEGKNKSDFVRSAVSQYIQNNGKSGEKLWSKIPDSLQGDVRKMLECIRDYQFFKGERPLDFSLKASQQGYGDWAVYDLQELLETKWSSKIEQQKKKYRECRSLGLIVLDKEKEVFRLSMRGKKLMKTLDGGNFNPGDVSKIDHADLEQLQERERMEKEQEKQATLGGIQ